MQMSRDLLSPEWHPSFQKVYEALDSEQAIDLSREGEKGVDFGGGSVSQDTLRGAGTGTHSMVDNRQVDRLITSKQEPKLENRFPKIDVSLTVPDEGAPLGIPNK